jgi:hypothetical protein
MDAGAGRQTQQHFHVVALRPPVRGRHAHTRADLAAAQKQTESVDVVRQQLTQ